MKADLRISIKDYHKNKNLKVLLYRPPFPPRYKLIGSSSDERFYLRLRAEAFVANRLSDDLIEGPDHPEATVMGALWNLR